MYHYNINRTCEFVEMHFDKKRSCRNRNKFEVVLGGETKDEERRNLRGLISKIYKRLLQLNIKRQKNQGNGEKT